MKLELKRDPFSLQASWSPFTFASIAPIEGIAFFRRRGDGLMLKAPWCMPLFTERVGYKRPLFSLFNFRVFPLRAQELIGFLIRTEDPCSRPRL